MLGMTAYRLMSRSGLRATSKSLPRWGGAGQRGREGEDLAWMVVR